MISIVICSRSQKMLSEVSQNVADTIGVPYEIISIDNSSGGYSICQAYNIGVSASKYDVICLMHEDILIKTNSWGTKILDIFKDYPEIGLLGVAGSSYKSIMPSHWSFPYATSSTTYINIIQHDKKTNHSNLLFNNPKNQNLSKVVSIDGVWMCVRSDIAKSVLFDEETLTNFHGYDVDFSLSIYQKSGVAVTFEVLIEHFSNGSFDKNWVAQTVNLHKKWMSCLPVNLENLPLKRQIKEENGSFQYFLSVMKGTESYSFEFFKILWSKNSSKIFTITNFIKINLHFIIGLFYIFIKKNKI